MFFPEKIKSISQKDKVLEVGPGACPHFRADVLLEKQFPPSEALAQRGYASLEAVDKRTVYYDGGRFPFADKEFDYVICSHVLEHLEHDSIDFFISELERVAAKGYIEFPNAIYEFMNNQPAHVSLMGMSDGVIVFFEKSQRQSVLDDILCQCWRNIFYNTDDFSHIFLKYKDVFFCSVEWFGSINYKVSSDICDVVELRALDKVLCECKENSAGVELNTGRMSMFAKRLFGLVKRMARALVRCFRSYARRFFQYCKWRTQKNVSRKAIIEGAGDVRISPTAEIKEYVIIRALTGGIAIGEYSQINPFVVIYAGQNVIIGNSVMIAPHCMIVSGSHRIDDLTQPMRFAGSASSGKPIVIEDDVWIGANCTITDGVKIGRGSVVGANSVVNKDVEPYSIVAGVPARKISSRI